MTTQSSPRNVLITGSTGLLGVPLASHLKASWRVETHGRGGNPSDHVFDLCERLTVFRHLDSIRPDVIVNLVALTNVDQCDQDRQQAYLLNVKTVENLVDWIAAQPEPIPLVHISTDQVYDGPGEKKEQEITLRNTYAWSKFCSEQVVARVGGTSLRTNFFGKSLLPKRKSFSDWVVDTFARGDSIQLFSDIFFSPLSIATLGEAIKRVVERPIPGTFNLGSHAGMSKAEFALSLANGLGLSTAKAAIVPSETGGLFAPRPKDMRMDSSLFERTFAMVLPSLSDEISSVKGDYELSK